MNTCKFCCTQLEQVNVILGHQTLLKDVDFHVHCNEITAIIGPNGAGKTTLFRTILGEIPYTGSIRLVRHEKSKNKKTVIGYVPQHLQFERETPLTVIELFAACLDKRPVWLPIRQKFRKKVSCALEEVRLGYAIDRKIGYLSGGELQRVLLALALMPTPDLLLLDEPISGVDVEGQQLFYELVKDLKTKYHMGILLITHDIEHLESICDQAILLNRSVLAKGDPKKVKTKAKEVLV